MHYTSLLALGLANLVLAQNNTNPPDSGNDAGFPGQIGDFQFYGCTESDQNHPTFELVASTQSMSLGFCAASCPTRFFGVFGTDCYCGDELDDRQIQRVMNDQCTTVCPGNSDEICGGMTNALRQVRRQAVPLSVRLSTYVRIRDANDDGITAGPEPTTTITVTSTSTGTITSCPPDHPDCPIGHPTVTTITSEFCPEPTSYSPKKAIVCYGNYCVAKLPCHGDHCTQHRVVCRDGVCFPEECHGDQHHNKLVVCHGDDCHYEQCTGEECFKKIVCYGDECIQEKCYGEECSKKLVCHGEECDYEECVGEECHHEEQCVGEECHAVPVCEGADCPTPPPPGPAPCVGAHCHQTPALPTPTPCYGEDCTVEPTSPPVAGSEKQLPALGMGIIAGLAFLL